MDFAEMKAQVEAALAQSREEEGYTLGLQAFKYGYPVIEMYRSRWEWHYDESSPNYNSPANEFGHARRATGQPATDRRDPRRCGASEGSPRRPGLDQL